jgi:hypothetical protein
MAIVMMITTEEESRTVARSCQCQGRQEDWSYNGREAASFDRRKQLSSSSELFHTEKKDGQPAHNPKNDLLGLDLLFGGRRLFVNGRRRLSKQRQWIRTFDSAGITYRCDEYE